MKKFTIISDPGIDDIVALALLNKLSLTSHCVVSIFGNAPIKYTTKNVREFISFIAPSWRFKRGSALPLNKVLERPWPDYFHGKDGVWGAHPKTSTIKIKELKTYPKNTDVISLGPMTNVLEVLNKKLNTIMIMGGAFRVSGNETAFAEANIAYDPDAASKFFKICNNIDVKVVPLDITKKVFWTEKKIQAIPRKQIK